MKVGIEQIRFLEKLERQQSQVWRDAADFGIVLDDREEMKAEIRTNLREILDTFDVKIQKDGNDRIYEFFAAYEHDNGLFHGQKFYISYSRLSHRYQGVTEIITIWSEWISQTEHGWKEEVAEV